MWGTGEIVWVHLAQGAQGLKERIPAADYLNENIQS